ncbi:MAG: hypothetical protein KGR47_07535 [Acidobacteria bacterium]|nr:hypothetical protein [Acidobacteriota bacterium]
MHVPPPAPPPAPPHAAAASPMVSSPRGRRTGAAVLVALVGVALGVALLLSAGLARTATVEGFARAPVGCTTTLQFERAGVFTLYLESKGTIDEVAGDCSLNGTSYDHEGSQVALQTDLTAADGTGVTVESIDFTRSYDTGTYRGRSVGIVRIASPGEFRLVVQSDADDVVVAVGGAPDADSRLLQLGGVVSVVMGLLAAALVMATGRRRTPPNPPRPVLQARSATPAQQFPPPQWGPPVR